MLIAVGNLDLFGIATLVARVGLIINTSTPRENKTDRSSVLVGIPPIPLPHLIHLVMTSQFFFFFFLLLALTEKQHAITFLKQPSWNLCQMSVERELTYETLLHDGNSTPFA